MGFTVKKLLAVLCAFGLLIALGVSTPGCGKKDKTTTTTTTTKSGT